ncbi:hypothetical protein L7F22_043498 [Adiantum nelumboides]|nr:hypothetical protein [Adiantum nelumboides]
MEEEDQAEAQNISSPLNVSVVDEQALESIATADMQNGCAEEEDHSFQSNETENGSSTQDHALALQPPQHQNYESVPAPAAELKQEGLNEGENITVDTSMERCKEEAGSMRQDAAEGEAQFQVEQEPSNVDRCSADVASTDTTQDAETLEDNHIPVQSEIEPELVDNEVCPLSGAAVNSMQQEGEPVEDETLLQTEKQIVTLDDGNALEKEGDFESLKQIEEIPAVSDEGENAADEVSIDKMQNAEAELAKANPEAELNDGECSVDAILMNNTLAQNEQKPEARAIENGSDDNIMVTAREEVALGENGACAQFEPENYAGLHEGKSAAENDVSLGETEESAYLVQVEEAPNMLVSADACGMLGGETSSEAEQSSSGFPNEEGSSLLATGSEEHLPEESRGLAALEGEWRSQDSFANEAVGGKVDAKQDVKADSAVLSTPKELNEKSDHQFSSATDINEPLVVPASYESLLAKEPSLCTPTIDLLLDRHCPEIHEREAGNDEQSGDHETEKEVLGELPYVPSQDLESKQPTVREGLSDANSGLHMKASLDAKAEPKEHSLTTSVTADTKQLEAVPSLKEELGLDPPVTEQASKGERDVAVMPMPVDNDDVDNSAVGEGSMERIDDAHLNGKAESSMGFKAANMFPATALESEGCHDVDEANQAYTCGMTSDNGSEANASKTDSALNATADSDKHMASEQCNGNGETGSFSDEGKNAQIAEVPMEIAVPLSSMARENGFVHFSEGNILGHQDTASINAQPTQEEKSREISQRLEGSKGLKQRDAEGANGNNTLVCRGTWWGCCGMLDALLHRG